MAGTVFNWAAVDPGLGDIVLVGPTLARKLEAAQLARAGLQGLPQIAVDGGLAASFSPFLWAGDGDSGKMPDHIPAVFKHDQNKTDLRFCFEGIFSWRWTALHLLGFFGERRDHELANYGELHQLLRRRPATRSAVIYDGALRPVIRFLQAGQHDLELDGRFSVLALEAALLSLGGACKYQAEDLPLLPLSGQGVSNEGGGLVSLRCDMPFMVLV